MVLSETVLELTDERCWNYVCLHPFFVTQFHNKLINFPHRTMLVWEILLDFKDIFLDVRVDSCIDTVTCDGPVTQHRRPRDLDSSNQFLALQYLPKYAKAHMDIMHIFPRLLLSLRKADQTGSGTIFMSSRRSCYDDLKAFVQYDIIYLQILAAKLTIMILRRLLNHLKIIQVLKDQWTNSRIGENGRLIRFAHQGRQCKEFRIHRSCLTDLQQRGKYRATSMQKLEHAVGGGELTGLTCSLLLQAPESLVSLPFGTV